MNLPRVLSSHFGRFRARPPFAIGVILFACLLWITSSARAGSSCVSTISANFNGTAIPAGNYIWFNANFTAKSIPQGNKTTIAFTDSTISFTADQTYSVCVPNARITFDPSATCTSTSFDLASNTWITTTPVSGEDEIFLSGVAFPVPASFANAGGKINGQVSWQGRFSTDSSNGVTIQGWKWGAAVYTAFPADYSYAGIKPGHQTACSYPDPSDHAGTPENQKAYINAGATGGGASNYTGGWSGTTSAGVCTPILPSVTIAAVTPTILETAGSTPAFTITRSESGQAQTVYVQATTGSGMALLGTDYNVDSPGIANGNVISVPFGASDTSKTISITPANSPMTSNESITWQVVSDGCAIGNAASTYMPGVPSQATVTLQAVTVPTISIALTSPLQSNPNVVRTAGSTPVAVVSRTRTGSAQTVTLTPSGAAVLGTDYTVGSPAVASGGAIQVTFAANDASETIPLTPVDDKLMNATKALTWTVAAGSGYTVSSTANAVSLNLTEPQPSISVAAKVTTLPETARSTQAFTVTRGRTGQAQTVYIQVSGTATLGTDYTVNSQTANNTAVTANASTNVIKVSFAQGDAGETVSITPANNWMSQPGESIIWQVVSDAAYQGGGTATYQVGSPSSASITLQSVPPAMSVAALVTSLQEDAPGTPAFTITRTRSDQAQTVNLQVSGTAALGTDYTIDGLTQSGNVITVPFAAGQSAATVSIAGGNGWLSQPAETIVLQVAPAGPAPAGNPTLTYTAGSPSQASVTLQSVPATVSIKALVSDLEENAPGTPAFIIARSRIGQAQTINIQTSGTAALGADYTADGLTANGNLISVPFAAGDASETVSITPKNSWMASLTEIITWQVAPAGPAPAGNPTLTYTAGNPSQASLNLLYSPPSLGVTALGNTGEGLPPASFRIFSASSLSPASAGNLVVNFTLSGVAPTRYTVTTPSGTITPTASNSSSNTLTSSVTFTAADVAAGYKDITINPIQDLIYEGDQTLTLTLVPDPRYALSQAQAAMAFLDDDPPPAPVTITAVIVSGASANPWKIVDPGQTKSLRVKGSLVALGAPGNGGANQPAQGTGAVVLQADPNLLDGKYVPPIMPTVIDSRVSKVDSSTIDPTVNPNGWIDPGAAAGQHVQTSAPPPPPEKQGE